MARVQHDHARDLLVSDFGKVRMPLSALNFWRRNVLKTKKGTADQRTPSGRLWKNYLRRNEVHMERQYLHGVPPEEFTGLEWGATTPLPKHGPRRPEATP